LRFVVFGERRSRHLGDAHGDACRGFGVHRVEWFVLGYGYDVHGVDDDGAVGDGRVLA
jgi:hypothetical protein